MVVMGMIKTEDYLPQLYQIAEKYDFALQDITVVPDIMKWSEDHGVAENNPWRVSKCMRNTDTGRFKILILAEILPDTIQSIINAICFRRAAGNIELLKRAKYFLFHLLLHEIAHAINQGWSEKDCDEWAFKELDNILLS